MAEEVTNHKLTKFKRISPLTCSVVMCGDSVFTTENQPCGEKKEKKREAPDVKQAKATSDESSQLWNDKLKEVVYVQQIYRLLN